MSQVLGGSYVGKPQSPSGATSPLWTSFDISCLRTPEAIT